MDQYFKLKENKTTIGREFVAGLTTFVSMAYILFVNPSVLGVTGMNKGAVFVATGVVTAVATIFMGVVAKYPFAIAPGLGINAFFAYSVVLGMKVPWQTALAAVFIAGIIFFILTIFKIREIVINSIPKDLKAAIAAGIGLFIAFIGFENGGIVASSKDTMVTLGNLGTPTTLLTIFGVLFTFILYARHVPASIFLGMIGTTIVGLLTHLIALPTAVVSAAPSLAPTFGRALLHLGDINTFKLWIAVFTFLLVTFFDTAGTLVGLAKNAGFLNEKGELPRVGQALMADSVGMLVGPVLGTSPTSAYIESSAGIAVGGRTGLTSIFTGILFLFSLIFSPLLSVVTDAVTAPALILVGVLMASNLADIDWKNFPVAASALLIAIGMPLTYSISDGISLGFVTYPILMIMTGQGKKVSPVMYALGIIFVLFLILV
ncbi:NCS2 family permease [Oenococcus sicerae]|uniref:NCS2 family permease n=1 Tax=Oenococcus sicerae TaxID=2203724 RepID=A0AAJ1VLG9_9LACO|nr:NCS2 family permease [Oenococcus sicerae]MDN6899483.1 NCS2 family permease [Oenococcus sicerae]QAS70180.1 NCS2 family permease [Oenococcus sicerae]VDK13760.1 Guanine/hypoxanthine permease PbuG [Oenococcus sicerae]